MGFSSSTFSSKSEAVEPSSSPNSDSDPDDSGCGLFLAGVEEDAVLTRVDFRMGAGLKYGLLVVDFLGGIVKLTMVEWVHVMSLIGFNGSVEEDEVDGID